MRYNVHSPCAFHSRIAKSLGVLVGAALVATLGLPSAVQAQTPAAPMMSGVGDGEVSSNGMVMVTWGATLSDAGGWRVEISEPGEDPTVTYHASGAGTDGVDSDANDPRIHNGVWQARVTYWSDATGPPATPVPNDPPYAGKAVGMPSAWASYHHGPPSTAPTGFTAYTAGPDARRLVWDEVAGLMYQLRYTADATDPMEWTTWESAKSGHTAPMLEMGTEYVFELRGKGKSRAGVGNLFGPSATITEMMPVPTPTLPEIAALFLAMLLLGSGAYLLRRRQSGGLTPA